MSSGDGNSSSSSSSSGGGDGNTTNSNREKGLSLLDMPVEVLISIFEFLCPHCCHQLARDFSAKAKHPGVETLKALSVTSRRLRAPALTVLLHQANRCMLIKPLTRLIDAYPNLGHYTKRIVSILFTQPTDDEFEFYKQAATRLLQRLGDDRPLEHHDGVLDLCRESLGGELLMALTPGTREVRLQIVDNPRNFNIRHRLPFLTRVLEFSKGGQNGSRDGGPQNVQYLIVESQLGPEGVGLSFYSTLAALTSFASTLRHLRCVELQSGPKWPRTLENVPAMPELEALEFENCTLARGDFGGCTEVVRRIVRDSPKLRQVKFSIAEWVKHNRFLDHINAMEFLEILLPRRLTLTNFSLDIEGFLLDNVLLRERFENLEVVELAASTFCGHIYNQGLGVLHRRIDEPECLTSLLPRRIKQLTIIMDNPWATWDDVREIGWEMVHRNAYICLRRIYLVFPSGWHIDPTQDGPEWLHAVQEMRHSFDGTDIALKLGDNYLR
ncbi:hypothetical protein BGZ63DRAFT_403997 [Mariannaea sp. PMI_226]|nr:hypothetical protein BGZ63DRAFT_403997 [Mariannaea sp. PMI_226]